MKTIYKYTLGAKTINYVDLPKGAVILSTQEQRGGINIYALVDNEMEERETFQVLLYGTGHEVTESIDEYKFLGTVSMYNGDMVFHVFHSKVK